jgi:hypothetical protein
VGQAGGQAALVEEHADEVGVVGQVREDALDRDQAREAGDARQPGHEQLGHAALAERDQQLVAAERARVRRRHAG